MVRGRGGVGCEGGGVCVCNCAFVDYAELIFMHASIHPSIHPSIHTYTLTSTMHAFVSAGALGQFIYKIRQALSLTPYPPPHRPRQMSDLE